MSEIRISPFSARDDKGQVFFWKDRVFRAIYPQACDDIRSLFSSGLVNALTTNGLFPFSRITDYSLDGYGLVVEHERIHPATYPYEWTFEMLKDAALTVLRTNLIAFRYGYETADGHGFNILFDGKDPKYIDLGSFVPLRYTNTGWRGYEEFRRFFLYPLWLWQNGDDYIARRTLIGGESMPHQSYLLYRIPLLRIVGTDNIRRLSRLLFIRNRTAINEEIGAGGGMRGIAHHAVLWAGLHKKYQFPNILESLIGRVNRLRRKKHETLWGNYYAGQQPKDVNIPLTPRLERIVKIVDTLNVDSVVDLGSNQGILAENLRSRTTVRSVICLDLDENALESLYVRTKSKALSGIIPVLQNAIVPFGTVYTGRANERFRSDAVLALAITHHLILSQGFPVNYILESIASYSRKYVLVEFMPKGLWDGHHAPPVPDFYTQDWFRTAFRERFTLLREDKLEENRVLYVGEVLENREPSKTTLSNIVQYESR